MTSFKQFLRELEDQDQTHDRWSDAAEVYVKHCVKFPDIDNPLYRISSSGEHKLKTRVPRERLSGSIGGTKDFQDMILSQQEWAGYPDRTRSIFCSTKKQFAIGPVEDDASNLLMIYPFDGVKIAMLDDKDFNTMNMFKNTTWEEFEKMSSIKYMIMDCFSGFDEFDTSYRPADILKIMKRIFLKGDSGFDPGANGNEAAAEKYSNLDARQQRQLKTLVTEFPQKVTPKGVGAKLITSAELDLPGRVRECWFSGKYLSIPARDYEDFKAAVNKLQSAK